MYVEVCESVSRGIRLVIRPIGELMDLPIVLSHKTAWLYHNVARPSEPLSRASSLYDEDSLANEVEPTASLPKLGLDAKGLRISAAVEIVADYLVSLGIPQE